MVGEEVVNVIEEKKKKLKDKIKHENCVICVTECAWDGMILCCELYSYYEAQDIVKQESRKYLWCPSFQEFKQVIVK